MLTEYEIWLADLKLKRNADADDDAAVVPLDEAMFTVVSSALLASRFLHNRAIILEIASRISGNDCAILVQ